MVGLAAGGSIGMGEGDSCQHVNKEGTIGMRGRKVPGQWRFLCWEGIVDEEQPLVEEFNAV